MDPSTDQSTVMIAKGENVSGTLSYVQYVVKASSVHGSLSFTIAPQDNSLSIVSANDALTANISLFYLNDQNRSFSQTSNLQLGSYENLTCTVSDWQALNSTVPQFTVTEVPSTNPFVLNFNTMLILTVVAVVVVTITAVALVAKKLTRTRSVSKSTNQVEKQSTGYG